MYKVLSLLTICLMFEPMSVASIWIIICGVQLRKGLVISKPQVLYPINLWFLTWCLMLLLTEFIFPFRHTIFCCWRNLKWIFAGFTAFIGDERRPITLVNSRRVVECLLRRFWQVLPFFCTLFGANDKVILIESISNTRNSLFCHGCKIHFLICIIKPKFCRRYMTMYRLMWVSCIVWLKINILSKYNITLMLIFLKSMIGICKLVESLLSQKP